MHTCSQYDALELVAAMPFASSVGLVLTVEEPSASRALRIHASYDVEDGTLSYLEVVAVCTAAGEAPVRNWALNERITRWLRTQYLTPLYERAAVAYREYWADYRAYGAA